MTAKTIVFPALPAGLTITTQVRSMANALLETVALSDAVEDGNYVGTIAGAHAGKLVFVILISGSIVDHRISRIADTAGPWIILSEFESDAAATGPYLIEGLVTDEAAAPLEGALIRFRKAGYDFSRTTDADGEASFAAAAGTYDVLIVCPGYDPLSTTLVVSADATPTWELILSGVAVPADPLLSTGSALVLSELGVKEPGVTISLKLVTGPGTAGYALDTATREAVSDVNGLVSFAGLIRGGTYTIWRSQTGVGAINFAIRTPVSKISFVVPNAPTFSLAEVLGEEVSV